MGIDASWLWREFERGLTLACIPELCCSLLRQLVEHLFPVGLCKGSLLPGLPSWPTPGSTHDGGLYTQPGPSWGCSISDPIESGPF